MEKYIHFDNVLILIMVMSEYVWMHEHDPAHESSRTFSMDVLDPLSDQQTLYIL